MTTLTLDQKIADAEARYHELVTGQSAKVYVDQNGERIEYTPANRGALLAYITRLKAQKAGTTNPGPMRIVM